MVEWEEECRSTYRYLPTLVRELHHCGKCFQKQSISTEVSHRDVKAGSIMAPSILWGTSRMQHCTHFQSYGTKPHLYVCVQHHPQMPLDTALANHSNNSCFLCMSTVRQHELAALPSPWRNQALPWRSAVRCHLSANQKEEMGYTIANQKQNYLLYLGLGKGPSQKCSKQYFEQISLGHDHQSRKREALKLEKFEVCGLRVPFS
ncbi:hypothetical protein EYF80_022505 [Liparis tanakae]|uniref:Uncharacterized protein n=1 Tax=Liparis tanakae TaxID=230148 RepID=A0A4Z2HN32_9TELE|nr:hypothetical protein EYF80_022505 [Liparis tanakae]